MSSAIEPVIEPAIVLAAYAEPLASGRRVLFVGPANSALPARLLERGARVVLVCDPDPARLAEATAKNRLGALSFSALTDGQLPLRDGAFDVCIVQDASISDPAALIKRLRRALTPRGVAIVASLNPEVRLPLLPHASRGVTSLDYYALYDVVKSEFEHVRMLGQAPFVGYVIADFAPEGTPEPTLDTAFLPSGAEEPELFVAIASQHPVELEAFAVVQLPYQSVVSNVSDDTEALRRAHSATAALQDKLAEAEAELATERQAVSIREAELVLQREAVAARTSELATERRTVSARDAKLREAESGILARDAKLREAETGILARDAKLREAETGIFARGAEVAALRQELEHKNVQLKAQEAKLNELNHKLAQAPSPEEASAAAADLTALEQALTERGEHVRKLERELREAERIGKELLRQLPPVSGSAAEAVRLAGAADLAQKLAKSQADLVATRWALEAAVKRGASGEAPEA